METRREFLEAEMNLKDLKQADNSARAVISLTKAIIGGELSQKIAEVSPPGLRQGWESIGATQLDDYERVERLLEIGEVEEEGKPAIYGEIIEFSKDGVNLGKPWSKMCPIAGNMDERCGELPITVVTFKKRKGRHHIREPGRESNHGKVIEFRMTKKAIYRAAKKEVRRMYQLSAGGVDPIIDDSSLRVFERGGIEEVRWLDWASYCEMVLNKMAVSLTLTIPGIRDKSKH